MRSRALAVRARYYRAKRDMLRKSAQDAILLENAKKVQEKVLSAPEGKHIDDDTGSKGMLVCSNCNKEFNDNRGLSSHLRYKTCEK